MTKAKPLVSSQIFQFRIVPLAATGNKAADVAGYIADSVAVGEVYLKRLPEHCSMATTSLAEPCGPDFGAAPIVRSRTWPTPSRPWTVRMSQEHVRSGGGRLSFRVAGQNYETPVWGRHPSTSALWR